ncbi:MAG: HAD hydrolase, family IA, variant 3 [Bacteroidetes bacterium 38_7]|nr:MAG: HAD hydrolase, family IA, variant 3 [Bacteroidetes bacterium 38_7]HAL64950.1 HAD family phosphatase [Bacteroidales bacterium]
MMKTVCNLILDFGGVILNIDYKRSLRAFQQLGIQWDDPALEGFNRTEAYIKLELGKISPNEFFDELRKYFPRPVSNQELREAWNAILMDMPSERVELLEKISRRYRLFLLSNTNLIHFEKYTQDFKLRFGYNFENLFEKAYWSFKMHLSKPNPEVFKYVLNDSHIEASETLFIDDTLENVLSAQNVGMLAYHLHHKDLIDLFDESGILKPKVVLGKD